MPSTGQSFLILGVLVALVRGENSTLSPLNSSMSAMNVTPSMGGNSSSSSSSTTAEGKGGGTTVGAISASKLPTATLTTGTLPATTTSKKRGGVITNGPKQPDGPEPHSDDSIGIIILVVIIVVALGFGVACYCARKTGRRYSVDFNSRADEANIPLSTMEANAEAGTQNGLKTFGNAEGSTKEAPLAEAKAEEQVEKKDEAEKSAADPSAESASPAKPPDSVEGQPKADPPASVGLRVEEITDEGVHSNKTSVESLREANENNSNSAGPRRQADLFWDVPLSASE